MKWNDVKIKILDGKMKKYLYQFNFEVKWCKNLIKKSLNGVETKYRLFCDFFKLKINLKFEKHWNLTKQTNKKRFNPLLKITMTYKSWTELIIKKLPHNPKTKKLEWNYLTNLKELRFWDFSNFRRNE